MLRRITLLAALAIPSTVFAESRLIDTSVLASKEVHGAVQLTPLAVTGKGTPAVVFLDLESGAVVPPHSAKSGVRLLTVVSGDMSWGDGDTIDEAKEHLYPAGSLVTIPADDPHFSHLASSPGLAANVRYAGCNRSTLTTP